MEATSSLRVKEDTTQESALHLDLKEWCFRRGGAGHWSLHGSTRKHGLSRELQEVQYGQGIKIHSEIGVQDNIEMYVEVTSRPFFGCLIIEFEFFPLPKQSLNIQVMSFHSHSIIKQVYLTSEIPF